MQIKLKRNKELIKFDLNKHYIIVILRPKNVIIVSNMQK